MKNIKNIKKTEYKQNKAFSLIEIMVSLIVLTILLAAFVPLFTKKAAKKLQSGAMYIKQDSECSFINSNCYLCDTKKKICLGCELSCIDGKTLNYNKCKCE